MIFKGTNVVYGHLFIKPENLKTEECSKKVSGDLKVGIVDSDNCFVKWIIYKDAIGPWYEIFVEPIMMYFTVNHAQKFSYAFSELMYNYITEAYNAFRRENLEHYSAHALYTIMVHMSLHVSEKQNKDIPLEIYHYSKIAFIKYLSHWSTITWKDTGDSDIEVALYCPIFNLNHKEFIFHNSLWTYIEIFKFDTCSDYWRVFYNKYKDTYAINVDEAYQYLNKENG